MNDISIHIDDNGNAHVVIDIMYDTAEAAEQWANHIRQFGGFFVVGELTEQGSMIH